MMALAPSVPMRSMMGSRSCLGLTRSTLSSATTKGTPDSFTRCRTNASPLPMRSFASMTSTAASTPSSVDRASWIIRLLSSCSGTWKPGVSTSTICAPGSFRIPTTMLRVVCGTGETIEIFSPTSRLTSVDLPAFVRPTTATCPHRKGAAAPEVSSAPVTSLPPGRVPGRPHRLPRPPCARCGPGAPCACPPPPRRSDSPSARRSRRAPARARRPP